MFKSNINKISRGRHKSEEQRSAIQNIKLFYESREAVIKLFNNYFSIAFDVKYKTIFTTLTRVAKVCDHSTLKILNPK